MNHQAYLGSDPLAKRTPFKNSCTRIFGKNSQKNICCSRQRCWACRNWFCSRCSCMYVYFISHLSRNSQSSCCAIGWWYPRFSRCTSCSAGGSNEERETNPKTRSISSKSVLTSGYLHLHSLTYSELGASRLPYSKSHERRQKRKAKEQLVGDLNEMQTILSTIAAAEDIASDEPVKTYGKDPNLMDADQKPEVKSKPQNRGAKIGEGKAAPLSKNQRQRALYVPLS